MKVILTLLFALAITGSAQPLPPALTNQAGNLSNYTVVIVTNWAMNPVYVTNKVSFWIPTNANISDYAIRKSKDTVWFCEATIAWITNAPSTNIFYTNMLWCLAGIRELASEPHMFYVLTPQWMPVNVITNK